MEFMIFSQSSNAVRRAAGCYFDHESDGQGVDPTPTASACDGALVDRGQDGDAVGNWDSSRPKGLVERGPALGSRFCFGGFCR